MTAQGPRPHHRAFKYRVAAEALTDGAGFARAYTAADGLTRLRQAWEAAGEPLTEEERLPSDGLALRWQGDPASPIVFVTLPPPQRLAEAHCVVAVPTVAEGVFRVFALEKAAMPRSGEPLVFAVEIRAGARDNYGPPSDDAPNDASMGLFCRAILDICEGKRKPYATTPV